MSQNPAQTDVRRAQQRLEQKSDEPKGAEIKQYTSVSEAAADLARNTYTGTIHPAQK